MHLSRQSFDRLVEAAIASLPPDYARWLDHVPIIVEDRPAPPDLPTLPTLPALQDDDPPLGLYEGSSQIQDPGTLPPRIFLYRIPLLEACSSRDQLANEIRKTLLHELGHHAGLDEPDLDHLGLGPPDDDDDPDIQWDLDEDP